MTTEPKQGFLSSSFAVGDKGTSCTLLVDFVIDETNTVQLTIRSAVINGMIEQGMFGWLEQQGMPQALMEIQQSIAEQLGAKPPVSGLVVADATALSNLPKPNGMGLS